jgi:hypothetical protein
MKKIIELKAQAYDFISQLEQLEKIKQEILSNLKQINDEIQEITLEEQEKEPELNVE